MVKTDLFVCLFLQNNPSLSLHISICLLLDMIALLTMMGALSNIQKKYASRPMIRKEMQQITGHRDDNVQKRQRKRWKETQMATERTKHPPDLIPAQNDWSNNNYYKQWINNNRTTALKQPTPLGWVLKCILLANSSPISLHLVYALV